MASFGSEVWRLCRRERVMCGRDRRDRVRSLASRAAEVLRFCRRGTPAPSDRIKGERGCSFAAPENRRFSVPWATC